MISKRTKEQYERWLNKAAHLGQLSDVHSHKIGAILVHNKGIVGMGFNKKKTHPLQSELNALREEGKRHRSYLHAELDCLTSMRTVPSGATLFIGRFDLNGKIGMCRPCPACMEHIKHTGIREIVYHTPHGFASEHL